MPRSRQDLEQIERDSRWFNTALNGTHKTWSYEIAVPQPLLQPAGGRSQLPRRRIRADGLHRAVCDYLAGMTDRYVVQEYRRLFGKSAFGLKSEGSKN